MATTIFRSIVVTHTSAGSIANALAQTQWNPAITTLRALDVVEHGSSQYIINIAYE